jgi:hypothetical protein
LSFIPFLSRTLTLPITIHDLSMICVFHLKINFMKVIFPSWRPCFVSGHSHGLQWDAHGGPQMTPHPPTPPIHNCDSGFLRVFCIVVLSMGGWVHQLSKAGKVFEAFWKQSGLLGCWCFSKIKGSIRLSSCRFTENRVEKKKQT